MKQDAHQTGRFTAEYCEAVEVSPCPCGCGRIALVMFDPSGRIAAWSTLAGPEAYHLGDRLWMSAAAVETEPPR